MRSSCLIPGPAMTKMPYCRCQAAGPAGSRGVPCGPLRAGFEAVIGAKDHRRLGAGQLEQALQHHVVKAIRAANDIFVELELFLLIHGSLGG